jgi:hypothetical protein
MSTQQPPAIPTSLERRFYPRFALHAPIFITFDEANESLLLNASENGLLLSTPAELGCNFVARIAIPLDGFPKPVQVSVRVVWASETRKLASIHPPHSHPSRMHPSSGCTRPGARLWKSSFRGHQASFYTLTGERVLESPSLTLRIQRSVLMPATEGAWHSNRPKKVVVGDLLSRVDPQAAQVSSGETVRVKATVDKDGRMEERKPARWPRGSLSGRRQCRSRMALSTYED